MNTISVSFSSGFISVVKFANFEEFITKDILLHQNEVVYENAIKNVFNLDELVVITSFSSVALKSSKI